MAGQLDAMAPEKFNLNICQCPRERLATSHAFHGIPPIPSILQQRSQKAEFLLVGGEPPGMEQGLGRIWCVHCDDPAFQWRAIVHWRRVGHTLQM